jgi:uncharacterized membrane protein YuzA (DUF378 family)
MNNKTLHIVAFILLAIGGLNWLLVGAFDLNVVEWVFGAGAVATVIYVLVGLAALYEILGHRGRCTQCRTQTAV